MEIFSINNNIRHPESQTGTSLTPVSVTASNGFIVLHYSDKLFEDGSCTRTQSIEVIYNSDGREIFELRHASVDVRPPAPSARSIWKSFLNFFRG